MTLNSTSSSIADSTTSDETADLELDEIQNNLDLAKCLKRSYISSKLEKVVEMVDDLLERYPDDKMIIVSQWTSILSLVARFLSRNEIEYCEIKGDVQLFRRNELVEEFNSAHTDNLRVMLLSLTAGGVGLNLVGANRMFLLDIHWNPALEQQCSDRIYRVGQRKPVTIYRFLAEATIEERIREIQEKKMDVAKRVCSAGAGAVNGATAANAKLTTNDFRILFKEFDENKK